MDDDTQALVVGGGVAGGAVACALAAEGVEVVQCERRDLERDPNRGDAIQARSVSLLERWGAADELRRRGGLTISDVWVTDPGGRFTAKFGLGTHSFLTLNHPEIELGLAATAASRGADLHPDAVRDLRRDGDVWVVETASRRFRARVVVGADGAGSFVRSAVGIELRRPKRYKETDIVLHGPKPDWLPDATSWAAMHRDGLLLATPSPPGGYRYVVGFSPSHEREWLSLNDEQLSMRVGERSALLKGVPLTRRGGFHVYRLTSQRARTFVGPFAALVGDAAHVTHPVFGTGMHMAIRDAEVLAASIAAPLRSDDLEALAAGLRRYDRVRRRRVRLQLTKADIAGRAEAPGVINGMASRISVAIAAMLPPTLRNAVAAGFFAAG
jgi:2-polyprenyl-6-methoxyphenol hydroxylase-like FAD-dependent oxidoreductase